ncbi:hypothetical protein MLD38_032684 [Melastoma candidum]|uniref:Uncharacterized protein n=1 Tax=Melastoma candidum TaxID=119954 RepID=A0ACB9M5L5_9MYRT|nr:hypothetical protein MLD38_032684 [Melastoma candidum]
MQQQQQQQKKKIMSSSQMVFQPHPQPQSASPFPGHFQLLEPQAQALAQTQHAHAHAQRQAQAAHAKFQAQLHHPSPNPNPTIPMSPSSSSANAKRSSQRPPSRPSASSASTPSGLFKTMELAPSVAPKKRKRPGNGLPHGLPALLPESAIYSQLLEYEARLDSLLARKKVEIQESIRNPSFVRKVLRVYVFNTFANQMEGGSEKEGEPPSWSLKITGRILEDGCTDPFMVPGGATKSLSDPFSPKFSSFFKKVTIYLDKSIFPDNHVISWAGARSPAPNEGFEVKRKGDKEFTALVRLELNNVPEKFKLSPGLAEILGFDVDTRPRILQAIWHYVKTRRLQSFAEPSFFTCDPPLQKLFGEEKMRFATLAQKLSQHLTTPQPIHIEHKIKLSGNSPSGTTCYDVLVDLPVTLHEEASAAVRSLENHEEFDLLDGRISASVEKMHEHWTRRAFFLGFSQSPAEFINALLASQGRDLKLAAGDASRDEEKEQHSDFYNQSWVEDAVIRYLNRRSGGDGPGNNNS